MKIVSINALPPQLAYVEAGLAPVLFAQPTYLWGEIGVDAIVDKLTAQTGAGAHQRRAGARLAGQPPRLGAPAAGVGLRRRARRAAAPRRVGPRHENAAVDNGAPAHGSCAPASARALVFRDTPSLATKGWRACRGFFVRASRRRVSRSSSRATRAAAAVKRTRKPGRPEAAAADRRAVSTRRSSKRAVPARPRPTARADSASTAFAVDRTARARVSRVPSKAASARAPTFRSAPIHATTVATKARAAAGGMARVTAPAHARCTAPARFAARNRAPVRR